MAKKTKQTENIYLRRLRQSRDRYGEILPTPEEVEEGRLLRQWEQTGNRVHKQAWEKAYMRLGEVQNWSIAASRCPNCRVTLWGRSFRLFGCGNCGAKHESGTTG